MATTEILPFATAGGANVQSQADFAAAASTAAGFSAGVAPSAELNKVWRQSSFMAAGLANWLVGQGISVPDDGNLANLVTEITQGIAAYLLTAVTTTQAPGDNSTKLASTAFVAALGALKANIADPTFTTGITTPKVTVTGSSVPTNGIYLSAANQMAISTNTALRATFLSSGAISFGDTATMTDAAATFQFRDSLGIYLSSASGYNLSSSASTILRVGSQATTRSINASGSINANGADYAEYMQKDGDFNLLKGGIIGVNIDGNLTPRWADAIHFMVKSTNPNLVGGDTWAEHLGQPPNKPQFVFPPYSGADDPGEFRVAAPDENASAEVIAAFEKFSSEYKAVRDTFDEDRARYAAELTAAEAAHEALLSAYEQEAAAFDKAFEQARAGVDRIAYCGRVPVNVTGATVGDYIVAAKDGTGIKAISVADASLTFEQYKRAVGKVVSIDPDGRARIIVKSI